MDTTDNTAATWEMRDRHVAGDAERIADAADLSTLAILESDALGWVGFAATYDQPERAVAWARAFYAATKTAERRLFSPTPAA